MPIAINGSGTVTGISVGGLPDGIVDTDMLANSAAAPLKRGSGATLQTVITESSAGSVAGSGDTIHFVTGLQTSITPLKASSKFLITLSGVNGHCNMIGSTGNHGARYFIYVSVAGGSYANAASHSNAICATHIQGDLGNWLDFPVHYSYLSSPSYSLGQALTFQPAFTKDTSMGNALTYYFNHNTQGNRAIMMVSEVAQS